MKIRMTRELAWAIAQDDANTCMRAEGRGYWIIEDYNRAIAKFNLLWPDPQELASREIEVGQ